MKKYLLIVILAIIPLNACSTNSLTNTPTATYDGAGSEATATTYEIDEDGNEILLESVSQDEEIVKKTFELQNLICELGFEECHIFLDEIDGMTSFQIAVIGEDSKSKIEEILAILEENLDVIDYENSTIQDYGILGEDSKNTEDGYLYP